MKSGSEMSATNNVNNEDKMAIESYLFLLILNGLMKIMAVVYFIQFL
jgi:hypothetical protein